MVPGKVSSSCPCVCSLGTALSQSLDLDLYFKARSVGLWVFGQCVAAVSSALGPSDPRAGSVLLQELGQLSRPGSAPERGFAPLQNLRLEGLI